MCHGKARVIALAVSCVKKLSRRQGYTTHSGFLTIALLGLAAKGGSRKNRILTVLKVWLPFFDEGRHAFFLVFGRKG